MENLLALANYHIAAQIPMDGYLGSGSAKQSNYEASYPNPTIAGVGAYTQTHCSVTLTSQGARIYSPPDWDGRAIEGHGWDTWGGLCLSPMKTSNCLIAGHRYIVLWHCVGQTSVAMSEIYWTNQVGWGQSPDAAPTTNFLCRPGANFQGEMECCFDFTINDTIFKTTGDTVHSGFEPNTSYLAYAALKLGFGYRETGPLGTDLYLSNFRMYDITGGAKQAEFTKSGLLQTTELIELPPDKFVTAQIQCSGDFITKEVIEY